MISYSSTALILNEDKILLVKRASLPYKGWWALAGGAKEDGETYEQCAIREVLEETGLCIRKLMFFGCARIKNKYGLQFTLYYIAEPCSFDIKVQKEEISEARFFKFDSLPPHLVPFHKEVIEDLKEEMK